MDGNARMAIERVITKLHTPPNPNPKTSEEPLEIILDIFWKEFDDFQNKTGPYGYCPGRFLTPDALNGNSYVWHHLYSLPYTCVLGFVACQVTWSDVKQLKDGKQSNLGGSSLEKRAILFTSAKLWESHIRNQGKLEGIDYFGYDDIR